jgi:hypothetical protein
MRAPQNPSNLPPRAGSQQAQQAEPIQTPKGETAVVLKGGDAHNAPFVQAEDLGNRDGMVAGTAVDEEPEKKRGPEVLRYIITREAPFTDRNGNRVRLNVGKVIDTLNYDVKMLLRQGVRMRALAEGEDPADVLLSMQAG